MPLPGTNNSFSFNSVEVILTEKGKPRYRLTLYTPETTATPAPVDYWARLNSYQPRGMTKAQARALHDENRGER